MSKKVLVISSSLRPIVTITALISKGITDSSLKYHLSTARTNGVTRSDTEYNALQDIVKQPFTQTTASEERGL